MFLHASPVSRTIFITAVSSFHSHRVFTYLLSLLELHEGRLCGWLMEMLNKCLLKESALEKKKQKTKRNKQMNVIKPKCLWSTKNT